MPSREIRPMSELSLCYELSLALALNTGAVANYCYANAWHTLEALTAWPDVCLVEGWMVLAQATEVTVIEHCWCERGSQILDPSIVLLVPRSLCPSVGYFPGVRRTRADLHRLACCVLPYVRSCGQFGADGMGQPEYCTVY
jgi:hypothetical protein